MTRRLRMQATGGDLHIAEAATFQAASYPPISTGHRTVYPQRN
jgi:hypothetical protein